MDRQRENKSSIEGKINYILADLLTYKLCIMNDRVIKYKCILCDCFFIH